MAVPQVGEKWRHFKGGLYTIVGMTYYCVDEPVTCVVYEADGVTWCRPLWNFLEMTDTGKRRFKRES